MKLLTMLLIFSIFLTLGCVSEANSSNLEQTTFQTINQQRSNNGKIALQWDDEIADVARSHSKDMSVNNFFSHTSPSSGTAFDRLANIKGSFKGENILYTSNYKSYGENYSIKELAEKAVNQWMNSQGHKDNILNSQFTHSGIGVYYNSEKSVYYFTQVFVRK